MRLIARKYGITTRLVVENEVFPYRKCSLAIIKDLPVVIGGYGLNSCSNNLFSFTGELGKWTKIFTPMPTARANPGAIVVSESLLVEKTFKKDDRQLSR